MSGASVPVPPPRIATAVVRALRVAGHALHGWWTIRRRFPHMDEAGRARTVEAWSRRLLAILGVSLDVRGTPPAAGPLLLAANHVSWLDIVVLHAARHCRFVAKAEVARWPLLGTLADGGGTLYVLRRSPRDALRVAHAMGAALQAGDLLAVFPEGTTGDGQVLLPFHGNLLQAAISAGAPVQPVALRYLDSGTGLRTDAPRYFGPDTLLGSIWRTVAAPPITARVDFGLPQSSALRARRALALQLRQEVDRLRAQA